MLKNWFGQKEKMTLSTMGLVQALGVAGYCMVIALVFWKGNEIFGRPDLYWGPVTFFVLFIVSAMVTALMVFYQPYQLFFSGKKKEAAELVLYTTAWLALFLVILLFLAAFVRLV